MASDPCRCILVGAERFEHPACLAYHQDRPTGFVQPDGTTRRGPRSSNPPRGDISQEDASFEGFAEESTTSNQTPTAHARACRVLKAPGGDACGEPAMYLVTFQDDDKVAACGDCALRLNELSKTFGRELKSERLK